MGNVDLGIQKLMQKKLLSLMIIPTLFTGVETMGKLTRRMQMDLFMTIGPFQPHNPWLSLVFDCHINVKVCCNITAVKYIYKYIYKGHDRANVSIGVEPVETNETQPTAATPRNEVKEYRQGRYFGASEAAWGLLNFQV